MIYNKKSFSQYLEHPDFDFGFSKIAISALYKSLKSHRMQMSIDVDIDNVANSWKEVSFSDMMKRYTFNRKTFKMRAIKLFSKHGEIKCMILRII